MLWLHTHEPIVSDGFAKFMDDHDASVAVAAGSQLWLFTADGNGSVTASEVRLDDVTALAWHDGRLWVAGGWQVWTFVDAMATTGDTDGGVHTLLPQAAHTTGHLGINDLAMTHGGLVVASGLFSCLAALDERFSMRPIWAPPGLDALRPESRWLLTGVAVRDGLAAYVSMSPRSGEREDSKTDVSDGGVVMDVAGEVVADGLAVPRQPRWHRDGLVVADSGSGRLLRIDPARRRVECVATLPGVLGALDLTGDIAVVGHGDADRAAEPALAGGPWPAGRPVRDCVSAVSLRNGCIAGSIEFLGQAGPIRAVAVLRGARRSSLASPRGLVAQSSVVMAAPRPLRALTR